MGSKLLIRPYPKKDESFYSWVSRVRSANMMSSKGRLLEISGLFTKNKRIKPVVCVEDIQLSKLSALTGVPVSDIASLTWANEFAPIRRSKFSRQFLWVQGQKVCPKCIEKNGYWYKYWQLLPVVACEKHQCSLVSRCKCGNKIPFLPKRVLRCDCGRRYSKLPVRRASDEEIKVTRCIVNVYRNNDIAKLVNRLWEFQFFLWFWYQGCRSPDLRLIRSWKASRVQRGIKYTSNQLTRSGINLSKVLNRYLSANHLKSDLFRKHLGPPHDYMLRMVADGYSGKMLSGMYRFEEMHWEGGDILCRRRYGDQSSLLTVADITEKLSVSKRKMEAMLKVARSGNDYGIEFDCSPYIRRKDVSKVKRMCSEWVGLSESAKLLGITSSKTVQLASSGLIKSFKASGQRDWFISKASCIALTKTISSGARKKQDRRIQSIDLIPLERMSSFPGNRFSELVHICKSDEIEYYVSCHRKPLKNMSINRRDLCAMYQTSKGDLLSADEMALILGININAIYYLTKSRLLSKKVRRCRNRKVIGFSQDDVAQFSKRYVFHEDAKTILHLHDRSDLVAKLKPIERNSNCSGRIRVYRRCYVESLANSHLAITTMNESTRLYSTPVAAEYLGIEKSQLSTLVANEWIIPYKPPSHHARYGRRNKFTLRDLERLRILIHEYPEVMPLRVASCYLGYDRSHVRRQFLVTGYLSQVSIECLPNEIFCPKSEVKLLRSLLVKSMIGSEFATACGVTRGTVLKWQYKGLLKPVVTPSDVGFNCYRYLKSDCKKFG